MAARERQTLAFVLFGKARVRKLLQSYAAEGKAQPESEIDALIQIQTALQEVTGSPAALPDLTESIQILGCLQSQLHRLGSCTPPAFRYAKGPIPQSLRAKLSEVLPPNSESSSRQLLQAKFWIRNRTSSDRQTIHVARRGHALVPFASCSGGCDGWTQGCAARLNDWVKWSQVKQEAELGGLGPMVEALVAGTVDHPADDFLVAYFTWWLPLAIDQKPKLRGFVRWEQEDKIEKFRTLIESIQNLAANQVRRAVSHDLPARDGVPRKSELGLLRHQLGLQRPSESIRSLIEGMPDTFTKLTPCADVPTVSCSISPYRTSDL